jgi:hypothetical protein
MTEGVETIQVTDEVDSEQGIDYQKLQQILEKQYGRKVPLSEAIGTGKFLLNIYEILLDNRGDNDIL